MERGKLLMDRRRVDLRSVLEQALAACRAELEAAGLTADLETGAGLPIVEADAARLQQVFSNLLRNSIKFTPPGGSICVRSSCDGDSCVVEVIDNGAGIAPEFLPRVFSAFEQGDKAQSRSGGLGLGLAICKMVVSLHGGDITAHSDGKGKGAKFVVRLPALVERPAIAAAPGSGEPDRPRPGKPLRILLVEDHADTAGIIRRLLKADGHTVHWVASVGEALKIAAAYEFDLLLSDLGLPDGTGVELMGSLRQRGSAFPGIVLSGYGQDQDITRTREAGFAAHLIKPLNAQTLREAIVRAMTKG
jgi:two-component system CheB/CheR fusion protein